MARKKKESKINAAYLALCDVCGRLYSASEDGPLTKRECRELSTTVKYALEIYEESVRTIREAVY